MNLLLDSHALLWWLGDSRRLGQAARAESLTVVTHDRRFAAYNVSVVWT